MLSPLTEKERTAVPLRTRPNPNECCMFSLDDRWEARPCRAPAGWAHRQGPGALGTLYYCTEHARELMDRLLADATTDIEKYRNYLNNKVRIRQEIVEAIGLLDQSEGTT